MADDKWSKLGEILGDVFTGGFGGSSAIANRSQRKLAEEEERRRQEQARLQAEHQARQDQLAATGRDESRRERLAAMFKDLPPDHPLKQINLPSPTSVPGQGPEGITLPETASGPAGSTDLMRQLFGGFETEDPTGALASTGALAGVMGASDEGAFSRQIQEKAREITELARPRGEAAVVEEEITRPAKIETAVQTEEAMFPGWEKKALYSHSLRMQEQAYADGLARNRENLKGSDPAEYGYGVALDISAISQAAPLEVRNEIVFQELKKAFPNASTAELNDARSKAIKAWREDQQKERESRRAGSASLGFDASQETGPTSMREVRAAYDALQKRREADFSGVTNQSSGPASGSFDPSGLSDEELRRIASGG